MNKPLSVLIAAGFMALGSATVLGEPREVTELIVRFKELPRQDMTAQGLASAVVNRQAQPDTLKQLSYPVSARPLIKHRGISSRQTTATTQSRDATPRKKSAREKLEEFIVLKYPNRKALEAAKAAFENDPNVHWVGENETLSLHASPADPLFPEAPNNIDYQWGLHALRLPQAWDYVQGHAYIAMLDSGIETAHPDLQENFRPNFSYDFGHLDSDVDERAPNLQTDPNETNPDQVAFGVSPDLAGHGTHVAGILAASTDNGIGGAGVCMHCSLMVGKSAIIINYPNNPTFLNISVDKSIEALIWMVDTGAQVINMSYGGSGDRCSNPESEACLALEYAKEMDVVMVAASGNNSNQQLNFPAVNPHVIAVGAVDSNGNMPAWVNRGPGMELVAPGVDVVSTFYTNIDYIPATNPNDATYRCRDSLSAPSGYGPCSGTSMASPHIAGAAALLRSANPLLTSDQVRQLLTQHASQAETPDDTMGHGLPNMLASVRSALGTAAGQTLVNRLTPLFRLYSSAGQDTLCTTSPQMAMAAMYESLQPQPEGVGTPITWTPMGRYTPGYNDFPRPANFWFERPKADAYIFTTHRNPFDSASELAPLYRLSYQGNYTGTNPSNVDHVYTTEQTGVDAYVAVGYQLDGIEGYIFPDYEPQPPGTEKLYLKYNPSLDDHAIFPESLLSEMTAAGYTQNSGNEWIGYVYLNVDSDSDGLIDGFEQVIGTDSNNPDSDQDGISDGTEVNAFPYSDPLDHLVSPLFLHKTPREVATGWYHLAFPTPFSDSPVLLSQMQSYYGGDTAGMRMRNLNNNGVELRLEEEQSGDTETGHTTESIGILGLSAGEIRDSNGQLIGEAGFIMSNTGGNTDWRTLNFSHSYNQPVVLMEMTTFNGGQPSHMRLKNVTASNASYQIEEWDYLDQSHTTETMAYIVIEQGSHTLQDGTQIRVGTASVNHGWAQIDVAALAGEPLLFSQSQTYNGGQAIVTRQRNIQATGFQIRVQEEEGNDGAHATETVGYLAIH